MDLYVVGHQLAESRKTAGAARAVGPDVVWIDSFLRPSGGVRIARLSLCGRLRRDAGGANAVFIWAVRGHPVMVRNFQRILVWLVAAAVFWLAGAFVHDIGRVALWAVALAMEYSSPSLGFFVPGLGGSTTKDWDVQGEHMAERCALFIIIALGESILVTGAIFSALEWTPTVVAAFVSSFVGSLAMWWLYFDTGAAAGSKTISSSQDPGKLARLVYTYIHLFIVGGIIVAAVADEFVLHHPTGHSDFKTVVAALGATALYLVGNLLFKWTIAGKLPVSHLVGLLAVAMLAPVASHFAPWLLSLTTSMLLIVVACGSDGLRGKGSVTRNLLSFRFGDLDIRSRRERAMTNSRKHVRPD